MAHELFPDLYQVFDVRTPWFDGYDGQKAVLFDEMGPGVMHWNMLKRLLDRYPMQVPVKGGSVHWNPEVIILTSNCWLELWYQDAKGMNPMDYAALERRVHKFRFPEQMEEATAYLTDGAARTIPAMSEWMPPMPEIDDSIDLLDILHDN